MGSQLEYSVSSLPSLHRQVSKHTFQNYHPSKCNSQQHSSPSSQSPAPSQSRTTPATTTDPAPSQSSLSVIAGWNSGSCGTCWSLTYNGNTINVLAMDHASEGFNIAQAAMDQLTNGQAVALGRIDAQYAQVDASACGL